MFLNQPKRGDGGRNAVILDARLQRALMLRDTDVQGAIRRFGGDEALYVTCLNQFLEDPTMLALNATVKAQAWDDAFTAAHALKGLAGNMGFVPLMHATGQLVVLIRAGRIKELGDSMLLINSSYRDIVDAIREGLSQKEMRGSSNENRE